MSGERLVKLAVKVQYENGMIFNMLADAPATKTFKQLEKMAADRKKWKCVVRNIIQRTSQQPTHQQKPPAACKIDQNQPTRRSARLCGSARQQQTIACAIPTATTPAMDPPLKQSQKWSISWNNPQAQKAREKQKAMVLKTKESKNSVLTDKQRAAWAHAHYIAHHGTASEAARFLTDKSNIINTPAELLGKVKVIAKMKVPTWEEAAAAVFSSSSEESSD